MIIIEENKMKKADIGLIGLAVMGQNLALNMNDHGQRVAVFNRTIAKIDEFLNTSAKGTQIIGTDSIEELIGMLRKPRLVMLMVKAGKPVDEFINALIPLLEPGDVIIDGGNSNYADTMHRTAYVESKGLLYVGCGVSGGEEGARFGPSIMPGGSNAAWPLIKTIFQSIAAKAGENDEPCCDWVGENGAGHYVKMVHNGIEYGDMQLICEAYHIMKEVLGLNADELHAVFSEWNKGKLDSYLIEITSNIFTIMDEDGTPMVDKILDAAGQKGTGKWTGISALEMGIPLTMIVESVLARSLSALKKERMAASKLLEGPKTLVPESRTQFLGDLQDAVYASKIISYTQGFMLMRAAAQEYAWHLNYGGIALMWRGGCIIRSAFLGKIKEAYENQPELSNLLMDPYFKSQIETSQPAWRRIVSDAVKNGIPVPAMASALTFYDGYRREWLPANLLQAQRDYFGAHTYERNDQPRNQFFHTNWTGQGGSATSNAYEA